MRPPRVLVLLAAYNGAPWITDQIQSIREQIGVDVDLLISDDGSRDATPGLLRLIADGQRVRTTTPEQPTGSAAKNFFFLIRTASADGYDFVALADQDDLWDKDRLARACARLREGGAAGYSCAVTAFWDNGREAVLRQRAKPTRSDFLFEGAGQGCTFVLTAQFYTLLRSLLARHAALTEHLHFHDWTIYAVCRSWRLPWEFDQDPHVRYRQHATNDTGARASFSGIAKRFSLIRKGWYARQLREIATVCAVAAPTDPLLREWRDLVDSPPGPLRKIRMLRFCMSGGRRRTVDNVAIVTGILAGWI